MSTLHYMAGVALLFVCFSCESPEYDEKGADAKVLKQLYAEIDGLSKKESCTDSTQWAYTAIGRKPCGGPSGYIAYSNKIDTEHFLSRVALYTELETKFNNKWGGNNSDCAMAPEPIGVKCVDGVARLIYKEGEGPGNELPSDSTDHELPVDSTDHELPVDSTDHELPVDSTDNELPVDSTSNNLPVDSTSNG